MGSAVSSAGRGSRTSTIKLLRALRHSQFYSYQSTGLTRERTKMTISCDIPTQMIVDDSSSSSSSPEQTNNLAEVMKARRRKSKARISERKPNQKPKTKEEKMALNINTFSPFSMRSSFDNSFRAARGL